MAHLWYYAHDGDRLGPFSAAQLKAFAASGQLVLTDTVWKGGVDKGALASKVEHLFSPLPASPVVPLSSAPTTAPVPEVVPTTAPLAAVAELLPVPAPFLPEEASAPAPARYVEAPVRLKRAVAVRGAKVVSQDGKYVKFRKSCTTCGHEDSSWGTLAIATGTMRTMFFCPKCRKSREVVLQGQQG